MLLFVTAADVDQLLMARVVQGFATGAITGAASALVVDLQAHQRTGSLVTAGAPTVGLGLGAILAGALVQHAPDPRALVFWVLIGVNLLLAVAVLAVPEDRPAGQRRAALASLRPSLGVPAHTRKLFVSLVPAMVATWALGGFYLSLGSSVAARVLGVQDHLVVGLVLGAFFLPPGLALLATRDLSQHSRRVIGLGSLGVGVTLTVIGSLTASLVWYVVGSAVAGVGFGVSFQVVMGAIAAASEPGDRAQTFATTYAVSYVAFALPAVGAGLAVQVWGLRPVVVGYGVVEVFLVVAAAALATRPIRPIEPATSPCRAATAGAGCSGPMLDT